MKYELLNKLRNIIDSKDIQKSFRNKIFVNPDNSPLVQREEHRLREKAKQLRKDEPNLPAYIKAGVLYHNGSKVDEIDTSRQLF
jgi:hypothetical protein